jgi:hypothetical protein
MHCLLCAVAAAEVPTADAAGAAAGVGPGAPPEAPTVLCRRVVPGCSTLTELCCQTFTPGRKYWVQASLFCKVSLEVTLFAGCLFHGT